jgi:hypothetical protein
MDSTITRRRVKAGDGPALYDFYDNLSQASKRTFAPFGPDPTLDKYEEFTGSDGLSYYRMAVDLRVQEK